MSTLCLAIFSVTSFVLGGRMVLLKGTRPLQVVSAIVVVRLLSVFLVQTWYVPDEYWQTLEVAHKHAFGYGALTWEWREGIRSYLYPSVVAALYYILKFTGLDYPEALVSDFSISYVTHLSLNPLLIR